MRLLHTSDWHLGRTLHGVVLHDAQEHALDQICTLAEDPPEGEPIHAVLISGDVYDRGVPPIESVKLFERTLARLAAVTTVIVTSGNHDSAVRLGYGSSLFTDRVRVLTDPARITDPVVLGDGASTVAVYGVPFLDPDHARTLYATDEGPRPRSHQAVVGAAVDRIRTDLERRRRDQPTLRAVVMAHAFVAGAEPSESERSIAVGGVERVAASAFSGLDYTALGHLHGPQNLDADTAVRYCGSPLRYSFSEQNHDKCVLLVDLPADGSAPNITSVPIEQPRPMATIRGELETLLSDPALTPHEQSWVRVQVTDRSRPDALMERITSRFPHALQVLHESAAAVTTTRATTVRSEADPRILGRDFIEYVTGSDASEAEIDCVTAAYEAAHRVDAQVGVEIGHERGAVG